MHCRLFFSFVYPIYVIKIINMGSALQVRQRPRVMSAATPLPRNKPSRLYFHTSISLYRLLPLYWLSSSLSLLFAWYEVQGIPTRVIIFLYIGTIAPLPGNGDADKELPPWVKAWLEPEVLVPILATIVVFIVGVVVICLTLARRNTPHRLRGQKDDYCMYGDVTTAFFF